MFSQDPLSGVYSGMTPCANSQVAPSVGAPGAFEHSEGSGSSARILDRRPDDPVSELLRAVQVRSTVYCVSDLSAPWGFEVEDSTAAKFHLVLEGSCVLTLTSGE
jgi:hypothetical protein